MQGCCFPPNVKCFLRLMTLSINNQSNHFKGFVVPTVEASLSEIGSATLSIGLANWLRTDVRAFTLTWINAFIFYPETGQTFLYINLLIVLSLPALLSNKSRSVLLFFILCFLIPFWCLLRQQQLFFNINTVVCISAPQKALMNTEWYFLFCCQDRSRVLQALGHRIARISLWDEISEVILSFILMHFIFQFNSWNVYFVHL